MSLARETTLSEPNRHFWKMECLKAADKAIVEGRREDMETWLRGYMDLCSRSELLDFLTLVEKHRDREVAR